MKTAFLTLGLILVTTSAQANSIYCATKHFNQNPGKSILTADIVSNTKVVNVKLVVDGELVFTAKVMEKDDHYRPSSTYANYIAIEGLKKYNGNTYSINKVLIEADFAVVEKFGAVVTEQASDGGSYNHFYCYNNKQ